MRLLLAARADSCTMRSRSPQSEGASCTHVASGAPHVGGKTNLKATAFFAAFK